MDYEQPQPATSCSQKKKENMCKHEYGAEIKIKF